MPINSSPLSLHLVILHSPPQKLPAATAIFPAFFSSHVQLFSSLFMAQGASSTHGAQIFQPFSPWRRFQTRRPCSFLPRARSISQLGLAIAQEGAGAPSSTSDWRPARRAAPPWRPLPWPRPRPTANLPFPARSSLAQWERLPWARPLSGWQQGHPWRGRAFSLPAPWALPVFPPRAAAGSSTQLPPLPCACRG
jgi:hypothetical protein